MTVENDRIEHAARLAWEAFAAGNGHADELWRHQRPERQARWREIARAVLVFFQPSEEVKRLESQINGLRRAYDHARAQRDKYMRRTAEWRNAAVDGWDLPEDILADMHWAVNEVGQTHRDNCDEAEDECGICKRFADMKERYPDADDGVRACTGCGKCSYCTARGITAASVLKTRACGHRQCPADACQGC